MKTLHFVEKYLTITETFIYNFIRQSEKCGKLAIVTFDITNEINFPLTPNIIKYKLPLISDLPRNTFQYYYWLFSSALSPKKIWYSEMKKIIDYYKPDVVHCHFAPMGILFKDFLSYYNIKINFITSFYGYDASMLPIQERGYTKKLQSLWHKTSLVLAEGPALAQKLQTLGAPSHKIKICPIIVDHLFYQRHTLARGKVINFLLIGRFVEKKGFHLFFEAIGTIKSLLPAFKINIIGSGPEISKYKIIIKKYNYEDQVEFLGFKPLEECINYILKSDVIIHPSITASSGDSEGGAPTILIESQIIGIPIICSDHADIPFILKYRDYMAKEGDVNDLCKAIINFVNYPLKKEKLEEIRKKVVRMHSMHYSDRYIKILNTFKPH